jgi:plastocyanin
MTVAPRNKRLGLVALAVSALALGACASDPAETTIQASAASSGASEAASGGASSGAPASSEAATTTSTTAVASMTPPLASGGPGTSFPLPAGCTTVTDSGMTVTIANIKYQPATLTVPRCSRVKVQNQDKTQHSVSFKTGPTPVAGIDLLNPGDAIALVVGPAGTYSFQCRFHATMKLAVTAQ